MLSMSNDWDIKEFFYFFIFLLFLSWRDRFHSPWMQCSWSGWEQPTLPHSPAPSGLVFVIASPGETDLSRKTLQEAAATLCSPARNSHIVTKVSLAKQNNVDFRMCNSKSNFKRELLSLPSVCSTEKNGWIYWKIIMFHNPKGLFKEQKKMEVMLNSRAHCL